MKRREEVEVFYIVVHFAFIHIYEVTFGDHDCGCGWSRIEAVIVNGMVIRV